MTTYLLNPALGQLLRYQSAARLRRMGQGFSTRRRLVLSLMAVAIAAIWLGNAALSIVMRPAADPETLRRSVSLGLLAYGIWHVLKVAYRRPEEAIEWTEPERELLCAGPYRRRDLLAYRFATILSSAAFKAGCFSLLMLPDLQMPLVAVVGAFLALCFLDFLRMLCEVIAHGIGPRAYLLLRTMTIIIAAIVSGVVLVSVVGPLLASPTGDAPGPVGLLLGLLNSISQLSDTSLGVLLQTPFRVFVHVILARTLSLELLGAFALSVAMVGGIAWTLVSVDAKLLASGIRREQAEYARCEISTVSERESTGRASGIRLGRASGTRLADRTRVDRVEGIGLIPIHLSGVGALAWRQLLGAWHYRTGLLIALVAPAVLSLLPLFWSGTEQAMLAKIVGGLAFYTFLLLPSALKFDFRRDIDRIGLLKTLPIRPWAIVSGEIAAPTLIASMFQMVVLMIAMFVSPYQLSSLAGAMMLLLPLNALIFGLDNLLFLLYPYRLKQENFQVFLRATLTFTAKGLIFALSLGVVLLWAIASNHLAGTATAHRPLIFGLGLGVTLWGLVIATIRLLAWAFRRFDPSQDTPG